MIWYYMLYLWIMLTLKMNNIHYHTTNDDTGLSYARQLSTNAEYSGYQWWLSYDYVPTEDMTLYVVMDYDIL